MTKKCGEIAEGWISHELCSPMYLENNILPKLKEGSTSNKIPEIFKGFGKGIREFKDASREIKKEIEKESDSDSEKK